MTARIAEVVLSTEMYQNKIELPVLKFLLLVKKLKENLKLTSRKIV